MKKILKKKKIYFIICSIFVLLIILSSIYIINSILQKKEAIEESNLLNEINYEEITYELLEEELTQNTSEILVEVSQPKTERMIQVEELKTQNSDIVGWLEIPNTSINYPVLQGSDNKYYMTHNYKKQKSKNGSIFLTKDYNWEIPSSNLLIFGHNLNNGTMFQELLKYSNKSFYEKHPIIRFTTVNDDSEYEIIAVFKSKVYYQSEKNVFRYYFFVNAETEQEYNNFVENAKKESLYNIDATAKYGDQLITLSTCSYHVKDGRFAIVARKKLIKKMSKNSCALQELYFLLFILFIHIGVHIVTIHIKFLFC